MLRRRLIAVTLAAGALAATAGCAAAKPPPFNRAAFEAAQAAGRPILLDIYAPWCPTCRAQAPIIERLAAEPANAQLIVFRVDFDRDKATVRALGANRQSTLIAYRGKTETGRSVGDTDPASLARLVASTQR